MTGKETSPRAVIIVDWGTTSFRAALVSPGGNIQAKIESDRGIRTLDGQDFETVLMGEIAPWIEQLGALTVIALGMITSRNGWVEVPYVACPASIEDLANATIRRRLPNGSDLIFLAGITDKTRRPFPDVMRGEETQILGFGLRNPATIVLPGTHSKWARVGDGHILGFQTFVTGEIFDLLAKHSFIARSNADTTPQTNWNSFDEGVSVALSAVGADAAFLTQLFSMRTGMLAGELAPDGMQDYASGIIIGHEFRQAKEAGWFNDRSVLGIVGNDGLNARYGRAGRAFGVQIADADSHAAIAGALAILERMQPSELPGLLPRVG